MGCYAVVTLPEEESSITLRQRILAVAASLVLVSGLGLAAAPARASVIYSGAVHGPSNYVKGYCIDDPGNTTTQGTQVQVWACNGDYAQQLVAIPETDGSISGWELTFNNGTCLDASSLTDGAKLQIWDCIQDAHQIWNPINNEDGYGDMGWYISGPWYIDLINNDQANGVKVQVWKSTTTPVPYPDAAELWCGADTASNNAVEPGLCPYE
jgi:hypothetical protein